jgi:hypothetical protein
MLFVKFASAELVCIVRLLSSVVTAGWRYLREDVRLRAVSRGLLAQLLDMRVDLVSEAMVIFR